MKNKLLLLTLLIIGFTSCKKDVQLTKIVGYDRLPISDSIAGNPDIEAYIKPYRENINRNLDSVLAYSVDTYSKSNGDLNTAIGNFMADAVFEESNPIFKSRTGKSIDLVLLNHGGIRSIISKGNITSRTAYEIMPFDNSIVVTPLKGQQIKDMFTYLAEAKRAHPISKLKISLNKDYSINNTSIGNKPIDFSKTYYVATNDYLYNGGSRMYFLKSKDTVYDLDYKIRNILVDHFKKIDTLKPAIDDRFIRLKD